MDNFAIVIATRDRPRQIVDSIEFLRNQSMSQLRSCIVVDGSTKMEHRNTLIAAIRKFQFEFDLKVLETNYGKPTALNLALSELRNNYNDIEYIVFLDDDIHFRAGDLTNAISRLRQSEFIGVSPTIINAGSSSRLGDSNPKRFGSKHQGRITKYGENFWVHKPNSESSIVETDWLPGGMSLYRWSCLKTMEFNHKLENALLDGYALGDDVDFSYRVSRIGKIGCLLDFYVLHEETNPRKRDPLILAAARGRWKAFLVNEFPEKVNILPILMYEAIKSIWHTLRFEEYEKPYLEFFYFARNFFRFLV